MDGDVYFLGFRGGVEASGGARKMLAAVEPFADLGLESEFGFLPLTDGTATVAMLRTASAVWVQNVVGLELWEALFRGARAAGWVAMPDGHPVCLTAESQRAELPLEFRPDAVLVSSGAELRAVAADGGSPRA